MRIHLVNTNPERNALIARPLRWAMISAFGQQCVVFTLQIFDGGAMQGRYLFCCLAFWACVPVILFRRRLAPTKIDLAIMHGGGPLTWALYFALELFGWF